MAGLGCEQATSPPKELATIAELGRPREEQRRAELRTGACEYLFVGVGAVEVVLDQLLRPLMAQFETHRSEADLTVADEDLWAGTSAAPASAPSRWGRCSTGSERLACGQDMSDGFCRLPVSVLKRPRIGLHAHHRNHDRRKGVTDPGDSIDWAFA